MPATPPDPSKLCEYSDEALMDELSRRMFARKLDDSQSRVWCDDCSHFAPWNSLSHRENLKMPEKFNPCTKGHKMDFQTPEEIGDEYGFYRKWCRDRHIKQQPNDPMERRS